MNVPAATSIGLAGATPSRAGLLPSRRMILARLVAAIGSVAVLSIAFESTGSPRPQAAEINQRQPQSLVGKRVTIAPATPLFDDEETKRIMDRAIRTSRDAAMAASDALIAEKRLVVSQKPIRGLVVQENGFDGLTRVELRRKSDGTHHRFWVDPRSLSLADAAEAASAKDGAHPEQLKAAGIGHKEQLGMLYRELLIFKDDSGFHAKGFAESGHARWLAELKAVDAFPGTDFKARLAAKSLMQLGLEYRSKRGSETPFARSCKEKIVDYLGSDAAGSQ